ncbi:MAG: hypothetical protein WCH77_10225 [Planctomycetota bacterium]
MLWLMRQDEYPNKRRLDNYKAVEWAVAAKELGYSHMVAVGSSLAGWDAGAARCEPLPWSVASTAGRHYNSMLKPSSVDVEGGIERPSFLSRKVPPPPRAQRPY